MKVEKHICDIEKCTNEGAKHYDGMDVMFTTEQNEGRSVTPYISKVSIDICSDCMGKIHKSMKYIRATGAMGYNNYYI